MRDRFIHTTISGILLSFCFTLLVQAQTILTPNQPGDFSDFGAAVALHGDQALIGAPHGNNNTGIVYAFHRNGTEWNQSDSLLASGLANSSVFGEAVTFDDRFALIGAPNHNDSRGAVYIFEQNNNAWTETAMLEPTNLQQFDGFGLSVALDDSTALIGSPGSDNRNGAAYLYEWDGTEWIQRDRWMPDADTNRTDFGNAVAVQNGWALVGAPEREASQGGVYVYRRTETGWAGDTLLVPDDEVYARFGVSVAIDDSLIAIGARSAVNDFGAVYVYRRNGLQWTQEAKLLADDGADGSFFGGKVSVDQNRILVGARGDRNLTGAVYLFRKEGNQWRQTKWTTDGGREDDVFGSDVALSGDRALVGAPGTNNRAGLAYIQQVVDTAPVDIETGTLPARFELIGNYPNPFNRTTQIIYQLDHPSRITLTVFDLLGRKRGVMIHNRHQTAGRHSASFDASTLPGGLYLYRLSVDGQHHTRSMTVLK